jgi:hypothetical protein
MMPVARVREVEVIDLLDSESDTENAEQDDITHLLSLEKLLEQEWEQPNGPAKSSMHGLFDMAAHNRASPPCTTEATNQNSCKQASKHRHAASTGGCGGDGGTARRRPRGNCRPPKSSMASKVPTH